MGEVGTDMRVMRSCGNKCNGGRSGRDNRRASSDATRSSRTEKSENNIDMKSARGSF